MTYVTGESSQQSALSIQSQTAIRDSLLAIRESFRVIANCEWRAAE